MKIKDILDLAERLKHHDKLKEMSNFATYGGFPTAITITVKKGATTKSLSITNAEDIEGFLTQIDATVTSIESRLKELNIGE